MFDPRVTLPVRFLPPPTDREQKKRLRTEFPFLSGLYAGCENDPFSQGLCSVLYTVWLGGRASLPDMFVDQDRWQAAMDEVDRSLKDQESMLDLVAAHPPLQRFTQARGLDAAFVDGGVAGYAAALELYAESRPQVPHAASEPDDVDFDDLVDRAANDVVPARGEPGLDDDDDDATRWSHPEAPADDPLPRAAPTKAPTSGNALDTLRSAMRRMSVVPGVQNVALTLPDDRDRFRIEARFASALSSEVCVALNAATAGRPYEIRVGESGLIVAFDVDA